MDAGSFQALAAILDYLTHFGSISCWHQSDAIQQELRLSQDAYIYCEFQKYEAMTMGQFYKTFTSVISKCSYCFQTLKQWLHL